MVKTDDQEAATTTLTIDLEEEEEQNMIDLAGNVTTCQTFHRLEGEGSKWSCLAYTCGGNPFDGQACHRG